MFYSLPPVHSRVGALCTGLIVLQVRKHRSIDADVKRVTLVGAKWHETGGHIPTMEVATDIEVRTGKLFRTEIVTCAGTHFPTLTKPQTAREREVVCEDHLIVHLVIIKLAASTVAY